eukprot:1770416-Pyramimonas_sp.AAC.1
MSAVATYSNFNNPLSSRLLIAPTLVDNARVLQVPRPTAIKLAAWLSPCSVQSVRMPMLLRVAS